MKWNLGVYREHGLLMLPPLPQLLLMWYSGILHTRSDSRSLYPDRNWLSSQKLQRLELLQFTSGSCLPAGVLVRIHDGIASKTRLCGGLLDATEVATARLWLNKSLSCPNGLLGAGSVVTMKDVL